MCFNQPMSFAFAALGLFVGLWIRIKTNNTELSNGVLFFFTMELLQGIQYFFIADDIDSPLCRSIVNKVLTIIGFIHICLQPYFCHVINASLTRSKTYLTQYKVIKRLCLIGGASLFSRFILAPYFQEANPPTGYESTEWLRGEQLCTFHGNYHLAWSVPMASPTYIIPGAAIHSFLMYAPFFALYEKKGMIIQGVFLFATGPLLAGYITDNLMEQASIWCFFSIAQISTMLFLIRETLIVNWGKDSDERRSLLNSRKAKKEAKAGKAE